MDRHFLPFTTSIFVLFLAAPAAFAQTTDDCEKLRNDNAKLKFENANLKKGIIARSPAVPPVQTSEHRVIGVPTAATPAQSSQSQTLYKVNYALVKCVGNAKAQTVMLTFLLTNSGANQVRRFEGLKAIDDQGEEYTASEAQIGTGSVYSTLATGVPVKAKATISKILPSTKTFKLVTCSVYGEGQPGGTIPIEFRDVAISWK